MGDGTLLDNLITRLEKIVEYHDELSGTAASGWETRFAQSVRIHALLEHRRIGVFDDTGVNGKTFVGVGGKLELDRVKEGNHPTLVISPNSGLLNAWAPDEINRYACHLQRREQKVATLSRYTDISQVPSDVDFVVVNWDKFSVKDTDERWDALEALIGRVNPKYYIFDECHSAKSFSSHRSKRVGGIISRTIGNYVNLSSATPIPNRYKDIGMILHMSDPERFTDPRMFMHAGPEKMKELFERQVWFRLTREDMREMLGLPEIPKEYEIMVPLSEPEAEIYFRAWADCVLMGSTYSELRKNLYDANLSRYAAGYDTIVPSKIKAAVDLTRRLREEGQKVLIKTNLVNSGILDKITAAVFKIEEGCVISAKTSAEERRRIAMLYRNSSSHNILVTTPALEESVDLTTGETPASIIFMEPDMEPRAERQFVGRQYRFGQRGPVSIYYLRAQSSTLEDLMLGYLHHITTEYGVTIPKKFTARFVDSDMLAMRRAKEGVNTKFYEFKQMSAGDIAIHDAATLEQAAQRLHSFIAPTRFKAISDFERSALMQLPWRNIGEKGFRTITKMKGWRNWVGAYDRGHDNSASQAVQQIIGKMLDSYESELGKALDVTDVGSSAAYLSRDTGREMVCVDIDQYSLMQGRFECEKLGLSNTYVRASATQTGLNYGCMDTVVNAYTLFYLGQDGKRREIEYCAKETNRILRKGGRFYVALPFSVDGVLIERFNCGMEHYGFSLKQYLSPQQTKRPTMKSGAHIMEFEKVRDVWTIRKVEMSLYEGKTRFVG